MHNPLFYNVLLKEWNSNTCYLMERLGDGAFSLVEKTVSSNRSLSYPLYLMRTLGQAVAEDQIEKDAFMLLRNLYEKTASFLGNPSWSELFPDNKQAYLNRPIQCISHSTLSDESTAELSPQEKQTANISVGSPAGQLRRFPGERTA